MIVRNRSSAGVLSVGRLPAPNQQPGGYAFVAGNVAEVFVKLGIAAAQAAASIDATGKVTFVALNPTQVVTDAIANKTDI